MVRANWLQVIRDFDKIIVPSPVLAELFAGGNDGMRVAQELSAQAGGLRIVPLAASGAEHAGKRTAQILRARDDLSRNVVKFDALILGVALQERADAILTTNKSDFQRMLALNPAVLQPPEIIVMDEPLKGQMDLLAAVVPLPVGRKS